MQIFLARDNKQAGPYTLEQVNTMLADGQVELSDLAWHEGMQNWQPMGELTGGQFHYSGTPAPKQPHTPAVPNTQAENNPYRRNKTEINKVTEPTLATKSQRISAAMLDFALFIACILPLAKYMGEIQTIQKKYMEQISSGSGDLLSIMNKMSNEMMQQVPASTISFVGLAILAYLGLQFLLLVIRSQTIGKAVVGIRVVNIETLAVPNKVDLLLKRTFIIGIFFLFLGNIAMVLYLIFVLLNRENRVFHERLSNTALYKAVPDQLKTKK